MSNLELAKTAFQKDELNNFILGREPYEIPSKFMNTGETTDGSVVYASLAEYLTMQNHNKKLVSQLQSALEDLIHSKLEIMTLAGIIMLEYDSVHDSEPFLGIDGKKIATALNQAIKAKHEQLSNEKVLFGANRHKDGLLGILAKLSQMTVDRGGPAFI